MRESFRVDCRPSPPQAQLGLGVGAGGAGPRQLGTPGMLPSCYTLTVEPARDFWISGYGVDQCGNGRGTVRARVDSSCCMIHSAAWQPPKKSPGAKFTCAFRPQRQVRRPTAKTLREWAELPPWEGGWSPFTSVAVCWEQAAEDSSMQKHELLTKHPFTSYLDACRIRVRYHGSIMLSIRTPVFRTRTAHSTTNSGTWSKSRLAAGRTMTSCLSRARLRWISTTRTRLPAPLPVVNAR